MGLALVTRAQNQNLRSILDSKHPEELELAEKIFGDMSNFSNLKIPSRWKEAGPAVFPVKRPIRRTKSRQLWGIVGDDISKEVSQGFLAPGALRRSQEMVVDQGKMDTAVFDKMLSHSTNCIAESITRVPKVCSQLEYDSGASLNFINITIVMTDKPAQECQRQSCHGAILDLASQDENMRDEIYIQVVKQIRGNPSGKSCKLGWELLHHLCSSIPPSPALCEFIRAFARDQKEKLKANPEMADWAEEETENVLKALKGNNLWHRVGDFWETVFWCVDAVSGSVVTSFHPLLDEASTSKRKNT